MKIESPEFDQGGEIPSRFTCDGENINPSLLVSGVPEEAKSLVLIVDDPDATRGKIWDHWIVWNIAPDTKEISENSIPLGAVVGENSWPRNEYGGPCPPNNSHRYFFKIYALDTTLDLPPNAGSAHLTRAMKGHILDQAELMGRYQRK